MDGESAMLMAIQAHMATADILSAVLVGMDRKNERYERIHRAISLAGSLTRQAQFTIPEAPGGKRRSTSRSSSASRSSRGLRSKDRGQSSVRKAGRHSRVREQAAGAAGAASKAGRRKK